MGMLINCLPPRVLVSLAKRSFFGWLRFTCYLWTATLYPFVAQTSVLSPFGSFIFPGSYSFITHLPPNHGGTIACLLRKHPTVLHCILITCCCDTSLFCHILGLFLIMRLKAQNQSKSLIPTSMVLCFLAFRSGNGG